MGTIRATAENVPVHSTQKLSKLTSIANAGISQPSLEHRVPLDSNKETDKFEWTDKEVKSDHLNMHFQKDVDDDRGAGDPQRLANREYLSEYKKRFRPFSQYEYVDGRFFKKKGDQEIGSPWFQEVIELRKKAGEYRHRGWGTELAPQHMAEVYNQQLWDQVSRRSSLAALALITTTTQKLSKEEKEKENVKQRYPTRSSSRPHTATPKHPLSDLRKDTETVQKKKPLDGTSAVNRAARAKARSQSAGPGGRSPRKSARQIASSSYGKTTKDGGPGGPGWKVQSDSGLVNSQAKPIQRHPRPSSADPSLGCYEPVVKSPPEPTRVKSPEQAILMSPDPVNWTVPLDTSKSFTVTQNIREAPPSPRFRSGERFHGGDCRSIRHPLSGQHSSAGSTMASSPISARSAPVPIHSSGGLHHGSGPTGLSSSAPGHNTIMERPLSSSKPISSIASVASSCSSTSTTKEPIGRPKDYLAGSSRAHHPSDSSSTTTTATNERDHGTGGGSGSSSVGLARKSSIEIKPHLRSQHSVPPAQTVTVNGVEEKKRAASSSLAGSHSEKRQSSLDKASKDHSAVRSHATSSSAATSGSGGASTKSASGGPAAKSGIPSWKSDAPPSRSTPPAVSTTTTSVTTSKPTTSTPPTRATTSTPPSKTISTPPSKTTTTPPLKAAPPTKTTTTPATKTTATPTKTSTPVPVTTTTTSTTTTTATATVTTASVTTATNLTATTTNTTTTTTSSTAPTTNAATGSKPVVSSLSVTAGNKPAVPLTATTMPVTVTAGNKPVVPITATTMPVTVTSLSTTASSAATTVTTTTSNGSSIPPPVTSTNVPSIPVTTNSVTSTAPSVPPRSEPPAPPLCAKPIPGTTLRCLEDPTFMFDPPKVVPASPPIHASSSSGLRRLSSSSIPSSVPPSASSPPRSLQQSAGSSSMGTRTSNIPKSSQGSSIPTARSNIRILEAPDTATFHKSVGLPPSSASNIPLPTTHSAGMSSSSSNSGVPLLASSSMSSSTIDFVPPAPVVGAPAKRQGVVGAYQMSETPPPQAKRTTYRVLDAPEDSAIYGALPPPGGRSKASEVLDKARNRFDKFWGKTKEDEK